MFDWLGSVFCVVEAVVVAALASLELPLALAAAPPASDWAAVWFSGVCICFGSNAELSAGWIRNSCSVKLNRGGKWRPFGSNVFWRRSSSKNECAHACRGVIRSDGVYSRRRATRSIASGGVRALNTCQTTQLLLHFLSY